MEALSKLNVLSIQPLIVSLVLLYCSSLLIEKMQEGGNVNTVLQ